MIKICSYGQIYKNCDLFDYTYYRVISHWCVKKYVSAFVCGNYNLYIYIYIVTLKTKKVGSICDVVALLDFLMQRIVSI